MVKKLLAGLMLGVVLLLTAPATPAIAASATVAGSVLPVAQQNTAPPGPRIDPAETDRANAQKSKNKAVVAVITLILAGIVVGGRYVRHKKRKAAQGS